ncbi:MAG: RNA polymerase sigma factor, partial [Lachnospiraceae bacterium]|nr:RNA polymerase sigma factor [Lachnospiraceae bacterium]
MAADSTLVSAVDRMKKGEEEGFNYVYSRTFNYVYFRARSIMKNEDDARDLTQIVYMEAYKSIGTLDSPENIFSWLGGITYRQGMKLFRKKTDVLLDEDFEGVFENIVSTDKDTQPELSAEGQERAGIVKEAIEDLPEVQKATVIAYYFDGMKVEEIADMMDCSSGTVKSRLNYARKAMKKSLMRNPRLGRGNESSAERALKLLSFPVIFCAIQSMSENTVMAAPAAQALYAGICKGIGLTAGSIMSAAAGTAVAGAAGNGLSAISSIGSIAEGSVSSASIAAAGTAAGVSGAAMTGTATIAGTAAVAEAGAAIGSAAVGATTAGMTAATTTGAVAGTVAAAGSSIAGSAAAGSAAAATAVA